MHAFEIQSPGSGRKPVRRTVGNLPDSMQHVPHTMQYRVAVHYSIQYVLYTQYVQYAQYTQHTKYTQYTQSIEYRG